MPSTGIPITLHSRSLYSIRMNMGQKKKKKRCTKTQRMMNSGGIIIEIWKALSHHCCTWALYEWYATSSHYWPPASFRFFPTLYSHTLRLFSDNAKRMAVSPSWSTRPTTGCGARLISVWAHGNLSWQLSKRRNFAWFGYVPCHDSGSEPILQGILDNGRRRDQQRKR